ncbi:MAG: hypothetical protein HYZ49_10130 [Chloroflexi bacterium]|nr:hypothetical protein [Chloroflexota bacterium]
MKLNESRAIIIAAVITSIAAIFAAVITGWFALQAITGERQAQATSIVLAQAATESISTQTSLQRTVTAPSSTPPNTRTPIVTLTSTPSIQPIGSVFTDDFDKGINSAWKVLYGDLGMANGQYTVVSAFNNHQTNHIAILDGYYWGNLRIKVTLSPLSSYSCNFPCRAVAHGAIIIRYQPDNSAIGLLILPGQRSIAFGTLDSNGGWAIHSGSEISGNDAGFDLQNISSNEITVEAQGENYFAYINGRQVSSATISGSTSGRVGLWFQTSELTGTAGFFAPRFDNFIVESLP